MKVNFRSPPTRRETKYMLAIPTCSSLEYVCTSERLLTFVHVLESLGICPTCVTDYMAHQNFRYSSMGRMNYSEVEDALLCPAWCLNDLLGIWTNPKFVISSSWMIIHCSIPAAGKGVCPSGNLYSFMKSQWKLSLWSQTDWNFTLSSVLISFMTLSKNFWTSLNLSLLHCKMGG